MIEINIARDFTDSPGGRYKRQGPFSGEEFRENFLEKHFTDSSSTSQISINFDGAYGYAQSFLEEAFGGLARKFGKKAVKERLKLISTEEPLLVEEISKYIDGSDN